MKLLLDGSGSRDFIRSVCNNTMFKKQKRDFVVVMVNRLWKDDTPFETALTTVLGVYVVVILFFFLSLSSIYFWCWIRYPLKHEALSPCLSRYLTLFIRKRGCISGTRAPLVGLGTIQEITSSLYDAGLLQNRDAPYWTNTEKISQVLWKKKLCFRNTAVCV